MIPTAEEFFFDYSIDNEYDNLSVNCKQEISYKAIEFAKLHVQAALKEASEVYIKVEKKSQYGKYRKWQKVKEGEEVDLFNYHMQYSQDKKSILNAYPLENIK
jgi:hypothetical protein